MPDSVYGTDAIRDQLRARIAAHVAPAFRPDGNLDPHADEIALVDRLTNALVLPYEIKLRAVEDENARMREELERLRTERGEFRRQRNEWVSDMHAAFAAGLEVPCPAEVEQRWQLSQGWIAARVAERQAVRNGGNTP